MPLNIRINKINLRSEAANSIKGKNVQIQRKCIIHFFSSDIFDSYFSSRWMRLPLIETGKCIKNYINLLIRMRRISTYLAKRKSFMHLTDYWITPKRKPSKFLTFWNQNYFQHNLDNPRFPSNRFTKLDICRIFQSQTSEKMITKQILD